LTACEKVIRRHKIKRCLDVVNYPAPQHSPYQRIKSMLFMSPENIKVIVESLLANGHNWRAKKTSANAYVAELRTDTPSMRSWIATAAEPAVQGGDQAGFKAGNAAAA
jgi:hypothetical protein